MNKMAEDYLRWELEQFRAGDNGQSAQEEDSAERLAAELESWLDRNAKKQEEAA